MSWSGKYSVIGHLLVWNTMNLVMKGKKVNRKLRLSSEISRVSASYCLSEFGVSVSEFYHFSKSVR